MNIEEAIKVIKSALCLNCMDSDKCNLCRVTEAIHYIEDMSNELQWYREQDLVTREDVSRKMYWLDVEGLVKQIPKAKPPKEEQ